MKKLRKGFTLIELLIVIAIVGSLSAVMSFSVADSNAVTRAKVISIISNLDTCKAAAALY